VLDRIIRAKYNELTLEVKDNLGDAGMTDSHKAFLSALSIILAACLVPLSEADAADPWQYWNEVQLKHALKDSLDMRLKTEQKVRGGLTELFMTNFEVGLMCKPNEHFEFGPLYKYEHEKSSSNIRTDENRFSLEGTFKWSQNNLKFSNRHRISHRDISGEKSWRYRTRIEVAWPTKIGDFRITPFISEEIFYDSRPDKFNQNRAAVGFSKELSKNTSLELCYLIKSSRSGKDWNETNVIGLTYNIRF